MKMLDQRRVLIVEDEPCIALDIKLSVEGAGGQVAGVAARLSQALDMAGTLDFDVALLDYNLGDEDTSAVADVLKARGIATVFYTGRGKVSDLNLRWPQAKVLVKPTMNMLILKSLAAAA
ncbi:response regulator [Henriciella sp. AS95]|uniref:response regulator n=1 Tax=Henriciella sp. AS95 TaxID=3135782 RepID=UPI0031805316